MTDSQIVELAESVEFKSLPSGLHNVEEDLVYVEREADTSWTVTEETE